MSLKIGDVVYLNSGSPALTVREVNATTVKVSYQDDRRVLRNFTLPIACVKTWGEDTPGRMAIVDPGR